MITLFGELVDLPILQKFLVSDSDVVVSCRILERTAPVISPTATGAAVFPGWRLVSRPRPSGLGAVRGA
jgi:hypothetical protein